MEEKERYVWSQDYNPECPYEEYDYIVEADTGKILNDSNIKDLLNQQYKEIKKLQEIRDNGNQKLLDMFNEKVNELDNQYNEHFEELIKQYDELNKRYCNEMDRNIKQSQKQLAISELEKVKKYWDWYKNTEYKKGLLMDYFIDNRIKELEGGENE